MTIVWNNRIRDYLVSKGIGIIEATNIQTYVNRLTTCFSTIEENAELIRMLEAIIRPISDIARATYGLGSDQFGILNWITKNRADIPLNLATLYSEVVAIDLNTNMVSVSSNLDTYMTMVVGTLENTTRYMCYFALMSSRTMFGLYAGYGIPALEAVL